MHTLSDMMRRQFRIRPCVGRCLGLLVLLLLFVSESVRAQTYPAKATTMVMPPYSVYLDDYFSIESEKIRLTLLYNDLNEPSWDVRLKFTLQSNDITIQTRPDFVPAEPITLTPGIPTILSSFDLSEYFNFSNLTVSGASASDLARNGRLPENLYSFCFEVLDYRSGKALSLPGCSNAWVILKEPPYVISPVSASVIKPIVPQNLMFTWQMANVASPNDLMNTEYQLTVYEVTDRAVEPLNAINNGKVLKIYTSEWLTQTTFLYDLNASILDVGKRYVFTVQARDVNGKDTFKNNGFSQVGWFDYGYPENGVIALREPLNNAAAPLKQDTRFVWSPPQNLLESQPYKFEFKLVEVSDGQDPADAVESNPAFITYSTPEIRSTFDVTYLAEKKLQPMTNYAWRVQAFTGEQMIAASPVYSLSGPPALDKFMAGGQEILVKSTENADLNNLNGVALVKISEDPAVAPLEIPFRGLKIRKTSIQYVLEDGEILENISIDPFELKPEIDENQSAFFTPERIRINKNSFNLFGRVKWPLPHPVTSGEPAFVNSQGSWVNFSGLKLSGVANLTDENIYELLDPYAFTLHLYNTSDFFISKNQFKLRLNGKMILPEKFRGEKQGRVEVPFQLKDQLYYFTVKDLQLDNNINILQNSGITLVPHTVVFDFSEKKSPEKFLTNNAWKGLYFEAFDILYPKKTEGTNQLVLKENIVHQHQLDVTNSTKAWATGSGLTCSYKSLFLSTDAANFNTFPGKIKEITFNLVDGTISNSEMKGSMLIPVIDDTREFTYTIPLADNGFQTGYLDQSLEERQFVFNPYGGESKVEVTIKRAVFADNERLDMTVDVAIPYINAVMTGVNDFRVYGDFFIGFGKRNGSLHLDNHVIGSYDGFTMYIDQIAASLDNGNYAFSYSATMPLGEEVSGNDGPPRVNIHSVEKGSDRLARVNIDNDVPSDMPAPSDASNGSGVLKFDSTYIKIDASIVELAGYLKITKDDPKWGTSFQGGIKGEIKIPTRIEAGANLVLGDRDNLKYWYFDAWFIDHQGAGIPVFNMFNLVAFEGKVYRHMELDLTKPSNGASPNLVINPEVQFGAGLYLQLTDKAGGRQFMTDIAAEVLVKDQGFIVAMEGDISAINDNGRNLNAAAGLRQVALKKAAAEAAKQAVQAMGEINVDIPIGGGTTLGVKASGTGGGLSYSTGDMSVGFEGKVGDVPTASAFFKSGSKEISVSGNADAYAELRLKDGSNQLGLNIQGRNGGSLNLNYDQFQIETAFNKLEGSGSVLFRYDDKLIDVAANKQDGNGHLALQYGETKRMYLELDRAGRGNFEFQYDDNLVAVSGDKETGSGSLKVEVGENKVAVEANKSEGTGSLVVESGNKLFSIHANKNGSGGLRLTDGNNLFDVQADKVAGTAQMELKYGDDKRMFIAGDKIGKGELEFEYGSKAFRIAADKTIGLGELRLKDGDDKYFNVLVNKSENKGLLGFRYGLDSVTAMIDNDTSALAFAIQNKMMAVGVHTAGKGGLRFQDGGKLIEIIADRTQGSGSLRFEDGSDRRIFVAANKSQGTGQLEFAYDGNNLETSISPDEGSLAFAIQGTEFNISANRDGSGALGFAHGDKSFAVEISGRTGSFVLNDGTRMLSLDRERTLRFKDGSREIYIPFESLESLTNASIRDGDRTIALSTDASGNKFYETTINGVSVMFLIGAEGNFIRFRQSGNAFEMGLNASGYGRLALTLNGTTYSAVQDNSNTFTLSDGFRSLSVSGDRTLLFREGTSKSVSITPTEVQFVYDGRTLGFGRDKYISYADADRSFDLGSDGLSITEGSKSLTLTSDKQLILKDGSTRSLSISAAQLVLENEGMKIELASDKSLRYSDPDRSFALNTQGLEIIQGDKSMALRNSEEGIGLELKDGSRMLSFSRNQVILADGANSFMLGGEQYLGINYQGKSIAVGDGFISYEEGERKIAFGGEYFVELKDGDKLLAISKDKEFTLADGDKAVSIGADRSFSITDGVRTIALGGESAVSYRDADNFIAVKAQNGVYGFSIERPEIKLTAETEQFKKATLSVESAFANVSLTGDANRNIDASFLKGGRTISLTAGAKGPGLKDSSKPADEPKLEEVGTQAPDMAGPQYLGQKITSTAGGRVKGNIKFYYNSIESHLIANASVASTMPPCLSGAMTIESRGDYWRIDIGSEQSKIRVFPSCSGFGGGGWLGLDPNNIDVGVFAGFAAGGSVHIDFGAGSADLWARIEAELGIKAKAQIQPQFVINEAGVWVRLYAGVGVNYSVLGQSGSVNVAEAELKGTLTFYFNDGTTMKGTLSGRIKVIGISADFDMGFNQSL